MLGVRTYEEESLFTNGALRNNSVPSISVIFIVLVVIHNLPPLDPNQFNSYQIQLNSITKLFN